MRYSTVLRLSRTMICRIAELMAEHSCGWIVRIAGKEVGIVAIAQKFGSKAFHALTEQGMVIDLDNTVCVRRGF